MNAVKKYISFLILFVSITGSTNFLSAGRFDKLKDQWMIECEVERLKRKPKGGFRSPIELLFHHLEQEDPDPKEFQDHLYISSSPMGEPLPGVVNFLESVFQSLLGVADTERQLKALALATYKTPSPFGKGLFVTTPFLFRNFREYEIWGRRALFPLRFKGYGVLCSVRGDSIAKAPLTWNVEWNNPWCTGSPERVQEDAHIKRVFSTNITRWWGMGKPLARIKRMFVLKYAPSDFVEPLRDIFRRALEAGNEEDVVLFVKLPQGNLHRPTSDFLQRFLLELMKGKRWPGQNVQRLLEGPAMPPDLHFSPGTWKILQEQAASEQYSMGHLMAHEDLPLAVQRLASEKVGRHIAAFSAGDYRARIYAWSQRCFSGEDREQQSLLEEVRSHVLHRIDTTSFQESDQALHKTAKDRFNDYWEYNGLPERYHVALMMAVVETNEEKYTRENLGRPPFIQFLEDAFFMKDTEEFPYNPVIFGLRNIDADVNALITLSKALDKLRKRIEFWKELLTRNPEGFPLMFFTFYPLSEGDFQIEERMKPGQLLENFDLLRLMEVALYTEAFGGNLAYQSDPLVRLLFGELRTQIEKRDLAYEKEEEASQRSEEPDEDTDFNYVQVRGGSASAEGTEYFDLLSI